LNRGVWEVLVSWQGRLATDTTWEKVDDFKILILGDELFLREGENIVDLFVGKVYRRRNRQAP
jgi:hypothetical protein